MFHLYFIRIWNVQVKCEIFEWVCVVSDAWKMTSKYVWSDSEIVFKLLLKCNLRTHTHVKGGNFFVCSFIFLLLFTNLFKNKKMMIILELKKKKRLLLLQNTCVGREIRILI